MELVEENAPLKFLEFLGHFWKSASKPTWGQTERGRIQAYASKLQSVRQRGTSEEFFGSWRSLVLEVGFALVLVGEICEAVLISPLHPVRVEVRAGAIVVAKRDLQHTILDSREDPSPAKTTEAELAQHHRFDSIVGPPLSGARSDADESGAVRRTESNFFPRTMIGGQSQHTAVFSESTGDVVVWLRMRVSSSL